MKQNEKKDRAHSIDIVEEKASSCISWERVENRWIKHSLISEGICYQRISYTLNHWKISDYCKWHDHIIAHHCPSHHHHNYTYWCSAFSIED